MRFCMMESAIKSLYDEVGLSEEVLSQSQSINLSLLLNAYYLNLTGSLDNLAWALTHHFKLITPKIDESNRFQQRFVNLTGKDFNKELEKKGLQKLANQLLQMNSWCISVKKFRNPAAHNIPLLVPYTIFSENDAKKYKELDEKAAELIKSGKSRKGMELLIESHNLGKHYPVFITE